MNFPAFWRYISGFLVRGVRLAFHHHENYNPLEDTAAMAAVERCTDAMVAESSEI